MWYVIYSIALVVFIAFLVQCEDRLYFPEKYTGTVEPIQFCTTKACDDSVVQKRINDSLVQIQHRMTSP